MSEKLSKDQAQRVCLLDGKTQPPRNFTEEFQASFYNPFLISIDSHSWTPGQCIQIWTHPSVRQAGPHFSRVCTNRLPLLPLVTRRLLSKYSQSTKPGSVCFMGSGTLHKKHSTQISAHTQSSLLRCIDAIGRQKSCSSQHSRTLKPGTLSIEFTDCIARCHAYSWLHVSPPVRHSQTY